MQGTSILLLLFRLGCHVGISYGKSDKGNPKICSSSDPQFMPHPTDCQKYIQCAHGHIPIERICSGNLQWSTKNNACDFAVNVPCPRDDVLAEKDYAVDKDNGVADCSCSDFISKNGYGQCMTSGWKFGQLRFCYVTMPSTCSDRVESKTNPGNWASAEACKRKSAVVKGSHGYVEYHPGDMNLIISAPHGGSLRPDSIPERKDDGSGDVNTKADSHTDEIAEGLTKHIFTMTGRRPHLLLSNLHRSRLDPNREEDVAAQGNPEAVTAYREYHDLILKAMVAAAPPQLRISSTGRASQTHANRMGDYYLTAGMDHLKYPVFKKVDNTQSVYVNDQGNWVVFSRVDSKMSRLRNVESGPASPSPPVRGWEFWDCDSSSWVSDPHLKVESIAPPYLMVSSSRAAASGQTARMGRYHLTKENHNHHPVYKKEDNSQVMFLNDKEEWAVFDRIDPEKGNLKSSSGATAIPPREGWQFCDKSSSCIEDSRLRVDTPTALLLDIHGQAHGKGSSELGYLLSKTELNAGTLSLEKTSIRGLIYRKGMSVAQMLHGPKSLGSFFENAGYKAVPSPKQPSPGKDKYFRGGFTIKKYGSKDGGAVDAIQIEAPKEVRIDGGKTGRDAFTLALANAVKNFYDEYYDNI